jgi:biopolymer transport protein ExbD
MRVGETPVIRRPIPLTPLIDVVFLLLMFFMLSSTSARFGTFGNGATQTLEQRTGASSGQDVMPGAIIVVSGAGDVVVNGEPVARDELAERLDQLFAAGARRAMLRAVGRASVQDLVSVLDITGQSRLNNVVVAP